MKIIKQLIFYVALLYCGASCNDSHTNTKTTDADTSSEETRLKKLASAYPDSMILQENLVQYYRDNGDYFNAISETKNMLQRDSTNARLWDIIATLHYENGDTLQSINAFEKAVEIFPDPVFIISLGTLYAETKNPKALELADALLIGHKANADKEAYFIKGLYFNYTNDKQKAISFFDKCLSLNFTFMDSYREKAIALYDLGKYEEALAVLDKALTLQNSFDAGYYYSGKILEKLNRKEEAIQAYRNALAIDPNYIEAKDALAKLGIN